MRIEDDSDSSFSCGPTPPNPNNDNDTSCILRLSPETLQRDSLPDTGAPWQPPGPTSSGGLRNLVYDEAYSPPPALLPTVLEKPPVSLDDVINNGQSGMWHLQSIVCLSSVAIAGLCMDRAPQSCVVFG